MNHHITIRPYNHADAAALHATALESVQEVGPWLSWCHAGYQLAEAEAWIKSTIDGRNAATMYEFAIFVAGRYAGGCGINQINWLDRVANLGYWVRTSATRQGAATAAARQLLDWAFVNTPLNRIEIVVAHRNHASQRVAEKLGAKRDGVLGKRIMLHGQPVDAVLYSVLRPD